VFAVPTYVFIAAIAALVVAGWCTPQAAVLPLPGSPPGLGTGRYRAAGAARVRVRLHDHDRLEAISNAVPAFEPVEWRNAQITLSRMIGLLIGMFGGVLVIILLEGAAFLGEVAQYRCASSGRYRGFPGEGEFRSGRGPLLVACTYTLLP
jgi:hypothetical protein